MSDIQKLLTIMFNPDAEIEVRTGSGVFIVSRAQPERIDAFLTRRGYTPSTAYHLASSDGMAFFAADPSGEDRALIAILDRRADSDGRVGLLTLEQDLQNPVPIEVEAELLDMTLSSRHAYVRMHTYWVLRDRSQIYVSRGFNRIEEIVRYVCEVAGRTFEPCGMPVRDAKMEDLAELQRIDEIAFDPIWRNDPSVMRTWVNNRSLQRARVVEHQGRPAGFAAYRYFAKKRSGHYVRTAIEPNLQGLGLGRALLSDAMGWFKEQGALTVELTTQTGNRISRRLYESYGFEPREHLEVFVWERDKSA